MKSGSILLLGPTNSGKSTLLNKIVGKRVTMVSRKQQSTTFNQKAVINISEAEFIFNDTPGIFASTKRISNKMTNSAFSELDQVHLIFLVIDISKKNEIEIKKIIETLKNKIKKNQKVFLLLNKTDKVKKNTVLKKIDKFKNLDLFESIFPISALSNTGIENLLNFTKNYLPKRKNRYSTKKKLFIKKELFYSEVTREKIYDIVHKEIPYQCKVLTEKVVKSKDSVKIYQMIKVNKKSHKNILIGKNGSTLKEIGILARKEISNFENKKIHLFLFVKLFSEKNI
ncbi:GTPase Era [Pelagibacteraceae bacterium]|nr:GTPase Era [Pelagibacteraceae bacterium]